MYLLVHYSFASLLLFLFCLWDPHGSFGLRFYNMLDNPDEKEDDMLDLAACLSVCGGIIHWRCILVHKIVCILRLECVLNLISKQGLFLIA